MHCSKYSGLRYQRLFFTDMTKPGMAVVLRNKPYQQAFTYPYLHDITYHSQCSFLPPCVLLYTSILFIKPQSMTWFSLMH